MTYNMLKTAIIIIAILGLTLTACAPSPAVAPESTAAPTLVPTDVPTALPTVAPTPVALAPGVAVDAEGISFRYDSLLANDVTVQRVPAVTDSSLPYFAVAPEHLEITFEGYPAESYGAQIQVFSLDAYLKQVADSAFIVGEAGALRELLAQPQDLNQKYPVYIALGQEDSAAITPPTIPALNARISVAAQKGYVSFANGTGMRFVLWASQGLMYTDPAFLFYRYQGLTADGKHYVVATFAVRAPIDVALPAVDGNTTAAELDAFNHDMADRIEAADPSAFTPSLTMLDALMGSLAIGPLAP